MKKRILATFLWFYAGWYAGALIAFALDISPLIGPIFGAAAAGLLTGDPLGIIWGARRTEPAPTVAKQEPA